MKIGLLALWGDSLTYTLAKAIAFNGHEVYLQVADAVRHNRAIWGTPQRIAAISGVTVTTGDAGSGNERIDRLIIQGHPSLLQHRDLLNQLAPRATHITAVSSGDRSRSWRQAQRLQWQEWRWYGQWFHKVDRIAYKDGFYQFDLFGLRKSRRVIGFDAHSKFLDDRNLFETIHAVNWDIDAPRPVRANFIGSRDPEIRNRILTNVEPFFSDDRFGQRMVWHAYTDAQPVALSPMEFLDALSESDFTLAPPGYSLVTHRPIEAMLRGSIPVLNADELDLYDIGLLDGVNCIAVRPGGWPATMERLVGMDIRDIVAMRRNIRAILEERLAYPALSRNICRRLGLS